MKKTLSFVLIFAIILIGIICFNKREREDGSKALKTLTIWHTESSPVTHQVLREFNRSFEIENNVKVICELVTWGKLSTKLKIALEGDSDEMLPDISHLQPYMAYPLYFDGYLEDISDIVQQLEKDNGEIKSAVKKLQYFDNKYYGLAQHVGVSFILYRADLLEKHDLSAPKTWDDFFNVCEKLKVAEGGDFYPIAIPASSPFFIECILSEYLNSRQASLFNHRGEPELIGNQGLKDALNIFVRMTPYLTRDCERLEYTGQFKKIVNKDVAFVMFAGARALETFERLDGVGKENERYRSLVPPAFNKRSIIPLPLDIGSGIMESYTSVDCEPFVIFKKAGYKIDLAKKWLLSFYEKENYLKFCQSVPIQLIPIFGNMDVEYQENKKVKKWKEWYSYAGDMIDKQRVRPYFMQRNDRQDLDFLFELHNSQIIYNLVISCIRNGSVSDKDIQRAQQEIEELIRRSSKIVRIPSN